MTKFYGKVELDEQTWRISAEPHILLRLKRVFERIQKGEFGTVSLTHTPENDRDLRWFMQRYAFQISEADEKLLNGGAKNHEEVILRLEQIIDPSYQPRKFALAKPARDYQSKAVEIYLNKPDGGLLIGDDVGLGKTITAIASLTEPSNLPAVVVAYPHLAKQWQRRLEEFAPDLSSHIIETTKPYELPKFMGRGPDVVILTYNKLSGWAEVLEAYGNSIIFDEVQELRLSTSAKYSAAKAIAGGCKRRMGLSATPVFNWGGEMFNIADVLCPGALGERYEFMREWCGGDRGGRKELRVRDPRAFGAYLRENFIMIRRTREDVGRELPPVNKIPYEIDADLTALNDIKESAGELARIIVSRVENFKGQQLQASEQLSNILRQATGIAKAPFVADFVRILVEAGEQVVLAGWHRAVYEIWQTKLKDKRVGLYTGSESPKQKDEIALKMRNGELDVLILSLRSGAGLDGLQYGNVRTLVLGELDWSPAVHDQVIGRLHRDGQDKNITAYFLVSDHGADPTMATVLGLKRTQMEGVNDPNAKSVEQLSGSGHNIRALAEDYLARHAKKAA